MLFQKIKSPREVGARGGRGRALGLTMDIQIPDNCRVLHKYFAAGWRGKPRELLCFKTGKVTMADTRSRSREKGGRGGWLIETELIKYLRQSRFMISKIAIFQRWYTMEK